MTVLIRSVLLLAIILSGISVIEMLIALRWIRSKTQWYALFFPSGAFLVMAITVLADLWSLPELGPRNLLLCSITLFLSTGAVFGVTSLIRLMRAQQARDDENEFLRMRYERLFKNNDMPILVSEVESGRVVDANSAAAALLEMPVGAVLERTVDELGFEPGTGESVPAAEREGAESASVCHVSPSGVARDLVVHRSVVDVGETHLNYDIIEDVTERNAARRALLEQKDRLASLADHDALTGLPNRRVLDSALDRALARTHRGTPSALLFLDVDDFKSVNDSRGHQAGDAVLIEIANMLSGVLRGEDVVARIGGDEFAILLELTELPEAECIARRLVGSMQQTFPELGLSIGVASLVGVADSADVIRIADGCMYEAKRGGKGRVVVAGTVSAGDAG